MLVITRRPGESLIIELPTGEQIEITVLSNTSNQVRIGTDAPADMKIVREVLLEKLPADS
jgi:carbon storage regulator